MTLLNNGLLYIVHAMVIIVMVFSLIYVDGQMRRHYAVLPKKIVYKAPQYYLGFKSFVANSYWLHLLTSHAQYVAAEDIYECAHAITGLDPHFSVVYRYAIVLLGVYKKRPELAHKLFKKSTNSIICNQDQRMQRYMRYITAITGM